MHIEIDKIYQKELKRQQTTIELIASENFASDARDVIQGAYPDITEGSTHYHNDSVYPYWADSLNETVNINNHIFYK